MSGRGQALFSMILSSSAHLGEGAEVGGGGWQPQVDLLSQMERTDRRSSKQRSFLGPACRGSQRPTVKQALFQREPLPWEGAKEASELPWILVSHPVEQASGACETISASSFPDCRPWGLLESVGWKLANRKRNAMSHLAAEICIQPHLWTALFNLHPNLPSLRCCCLPHSTSHPLIHTHGAAHLVEMFKGMGPGLWKQISDCRSCLFLKAKKERAWSEFIQSLMGLEKDRQELYWPQPDQ